MNRCVSFSRRMDRTVRVYRHRIEAYTGRWGFIGWGRRPLGRLAYITAKLLGRPFICLEDGFIRSVQLSNSIDLPSSIVLDRTGIYYDATKSSDLESMLQKGNFSSDIELMDKARLAMQRIRELHISKYNHAPDISQNLLTADTKTKILVIAQTAGDMSLRYGMAEQYSTSDMINAALRENDGAQIYIKIHPDVLAGKKNSDIRMTDIPDECRIIETDVNPISLLESIDKVYTKTSLMGFEALMLGKICVCFGMPFYAGWGVTDDRVHCERRSRKRTVEEIFAAAYLLYPLYYHPEQKRDADIFEIIDWIADNKVGRN